MIVPGGGSLGDSVFLATDTTIIRITAEQPGDDLGRGLTVFDVNDDGILDICAGAPFANFNGRDFAGKVRIFYGCSTPSGTTSTTSPALLVRQNRPNPFSQQTTIEYVIVSPSELSSTTSLIIYDVLGRPVRTLYSLTLDDRGFFIWDGTNGQGRRVSSGLYFYRLEADGFTETRKMLLLR